MIHYTNIGYLERLIYVPIYVPIALEHVKPFVITWFPCAGCQGRGGWIEWHDWSDPDMGHDEVTCPRCRGARICSNTNLEMIYPGIYPIEVYRRHL